MREYQTNGRKKKRNGKKKQMLQKKEKKKVNIINGGKARMLRKEGSTGYGSK